MRRTNKTPHNYLVREITISQPGYAYIFLSNENLKQVDVYFDDLKITHTHSPIVAGADFYPFGLAMDGREIKDEHYRWGYQGQYAEKDTITRLNEFQLRMYDARFGRFTTTDPYKEFHSPYVAMGNRPHMITDPTGGFTGATLLNEVVVTASRLPSVGSIIGSVAISVGKSMLTSGFAKGFCPDCPNPEWAELEKGSSITFGDGTEYILDDPSKGKDGWTRNGGQLNEVIVTPKKNFLKSFIAGIANPVVDVATTVWTSTRNGFKEHANGEGRYDQWYSYKVDQDGFYRNLDKNGGIPSMNSPQRGAELLTNTVSVNLTVASWGVNIPLSNNSVANFLGNQAIKQPSKAIVVKAVESAMSVH